MTAHLRRIAPFWIVFLVCAAGAARAQTCLDVNDCSGSSYTVKKDFTIADPGTAPSNAAGAATGGFCSASETYRTYVAWCNESGCSAVSPASGNITPSSGTTNLIAVTRPSIPAGATSWAAYFSKSSEGHSRIRHCTSTNPTAGTVAAAASTENCKCFPAGGQQQTSNQTGMLQTSKLHPDGTVRLSAKDGTVQGKLATDKAILEYASDLLPRFSPDSGTNFRTVDWNSATVYYVEPNFGASNTATSGRTVFNSIFSALSTITDSSYSKPYVLKVRHKDGTEIPDATINKPYVWIQGDGATRVGKLNVMADGVRISGLIGSQIWVGQIGTNTPPSDLDNIWIHDNIFTNGPTGICRLSIHVGAGTRTHAVLVSNNRMGAGANDPQSPFVNQCEVDTHVGDAGKGTIVAFMDNFIENQDCLHNSEPMSVSSGDQTVAEGTLTLSIRNTMICDIAPGMIENGEDFACISSGFGFGTFVSIDDVCYMTRQDTAPYDHKHVFMQVDQNYNSTVPRRAELINPTFLVSLAAKATGDTIAYVLMDTPYLTFSLSNPRYRDFAMGSGWSASDKYFAIVDGGRTPPPAASNTFLRWDNVVSSPGPDILYLNGVGSSLVDAGPNHRVMKEAFGPKITLAGADLGSTCRENEFRYDTGGSTKELCLCDASGAWKCKALGPLYD